MAKTDFKSVDEYIAAQPEERRAALKRVRGIVRKALPKAGEVISYQIPAYKLHGSTVLFFAGWQKHYSLYPMTEPLVAALKKEIMAYEISKGTIRFPLSEPVPVDLIERIAKFRAAEVTEALRAKPVAKKPAKASAKKPVRKAAKPAAGKSKKPSPKKKPAPKKNR